MFKRIMVAYDASLGSGRALASAIRLARALGSELHAVTVPELSTASTGFVTAVSPYLSQTLVDDQRRRAEECLEKAREIAGGHGIELIAHLAEGPEVDAILSSVTKCEADLLVIGLHQHSLYLSRLWSTVYAVAVDSPCSVLGVH
jgi:nucleotide-binding universal stress UspA family protein